MEVPVEKIKPVEIDNQIKIPITEGEVVQKRKRGRPKKFRGGIAAQSANN